MGMRIARLTGLGKNPPHRGDHEKEDREINDPEKWTGWIGLSDRGRAFVLR
jgi:hypothetical protein